MGRGGAARRRGRAGAAAPSFPEAAGDNFVFPHGDKVYGLVGVDGLLVVDTADALLVARRGRREGVKELVEQLRACRPAGGHRAPLRGAPVGRLRGAPRHRALQVEAPPRSTPASASPTSRTPAAASTGWSSAAGPEVTLDGEVRALRPRRRRLHPHRRPHRIANPGDEPVEIVEVQLGDYFGEDDIVRYEDDYERV